MTEGDTQDSTARAAQAPQDEVAAWARYNAMDAAERAKIDEEARDASRESWQSTGYDGGAYDGERACLLGLLKRLPPAVAPKD